MMDNVEQTSPETNRTLSNGQMLGQSSPGEVTTLTTKSLAPEDYTDFSDKNDEWFYADGIKGEGEKPEYFNSGKYKTLADQAKAHTDLRKKLAGFTGAPDEYELDANSEYFKNVDIETIQKFITPFEAYAKELNMSNDALNGFIGKFIEVANSNELTGEDPENHVANEMRKLGENSDSYVRNVYSRLKETVPEEHIDAFKSMATSAEAIKAIEWAVNSMGPSNVPKPQDREVSRLESGAELKELMKDARYGTDLGFTRMVDMKYEKVYG